MNVRLEAEQELAMVDAVLSFFSTLLAVRTYLGKYRGCRGRDRRVVVVVIVGLLDLQLSVQSVPITTKVVSLNPIHDKVYLDTTLGD